MRKSKFMYGADPEFAIIANEKEFPEVCNDIKVDNLIPPAYFRVNNMLTTKFLPADLRRRHPVFYDDNGIIIHEDGANLELSVRPSVHWKDVFDSITQGYSIANGIFNYPEVKCCKPISTTVFDNKYWISKYGKVMAEATIAGCDPDKDIDNYENPNSEILDLSNHGYRYCGGHIHLSTNDAQLKNLFVENPVPIIRLLKLFLGVTGTAFSTQVESDKKRLFHYGKPGRYRLQKYPDSEYIGYEYRTLSTTWTSDFELAKKIFERAEQALYLLEENSEYAFVVADSFNDAATKVIMDFNIAEAKNIYRDVDNLI